MDNANIPVAPLGKKPKYWVFISLLGGIGWGVISFVITILLHDALPLLLVLFVLLNYAVVLFGPFIFFLFPSYQESLNQVSSKAWFIARSMILWYVGYFITAPFAVIIGASLWAH